MAKTVQAIYDEIVDRKNADTNLSSLTSTSGTAIWRLWAWLTALCHAVIYNEWDVFKATLTNLVSANRYGTAAWYVEITLQYPTITIHRASAREVLSPTSQRVVLKVCKLSSGNLVNLTPSELTAFRTYMASKKVLGTWLDIVSQTADLAQLTLTVRTDGTAGIGALVTQAVKDYFTSLGFDQQLSKTLLSDYLLQVPGVLDVFIDELSINTGAGYETIASNTYTSESGYIRLGKSTGGADLITINLIS